MIIYIRKKEESQVEVSEVTPLLMRYTFDLKRGLFRGSGGSVIRALAQATQLPFKDHKWATY